MNIKQFRLLFQAFLCLISFSALTSIRAQAAIDPFNTDTLTASNPHTYWQGAPDLYVTHPKPAIRLPNKPLSLAEVTDFALRNNPATHLAWAQARLAAANLGDAKSAYWPQINAGFAAEYTGALPSSDSSKKTYGANLSLSYVLLDFGKRSNSVEAAQYNLISANLSQNKAIQEVILQVQQAYYQVLGQQALVDANQKSTREASVSVDATEALRKEGMATIGDVYQANAALAQARLNLEQSQGSSQIALGQLATLMGLSATYKLKLLGLSSTTPITKTNQNIMVLLEAAQRKRPDLLAAEAQVRASQSQLAATKAAVWPTLQINANAGPTVIDNVNVNNSSVALSISVPLFTGFSQTYDVRRAKAQVIQTAALRDQVYQDVQFQVWQAYYALKTAETSISTADILAKSSTQANQQALGQYKAGVGNILSVLTTQSSLAGARVQSIQARLNWYIALAQLSAAVGMLDTKR